MMAWDVLVGVEEGRKRSKKAGGEGVMREVGTFLRFVAVDESLVRPVTAIATLE